MLKAQNLLMGFVIAASVLSVGWSAVYLLGWPTHVGIKSALGVPLRPPSFRDCAVCPEMVTLPAGKFMMGSREESEVLPRRVVIKTPFAIGKFEVTFDQFAAFVAEAGTSAGTGCRAIVGDTGSHFVYGSPEASFRSPGFAVTGTHPVVCVSWDDAQSYVAWLKTRTGKPFRLPSDAEWEYAARAGTETYYSFGNARTALCDYGRFANQNSPFPWRDGCGNDTAGPIPVGQRMPNPWGIFDMHGNAWEWVDDCSTPPTDSFSRGRTCVDSRIVRGGSWANNPWELGSAIRRLMSPMNRRTNIGFRVALSLAE
jgi:formylglycine-generating enzyme required for sulfatase activity